MNRKLRYIAIVVFCSIIDIVCHVITTNDGNNPVIASNRTFMVENLGFELTGILYFLVTFGLISYIFFRYENKLPGIKFKKGLNYGVATGIIWLWGMLESVALTQTTLIDELIKGVLDCTPIIVIGVLLGIFTTESSSNENNHKNYLKSCNKSFLNFLIPLVIFSVVFLVGRYSLYCTNIIKSGYKTFPYFTFIWTLFMGTCIGIMYILIGKAARSKSVFISALRFGVIIFGINWSMFNIFIPIIIKGMLTETIVRIASDSLWVVIGYLLLQYLKKS